MMKRFLITAIAASTMIPVPAAAQDGLELPACNLVNEVSIYWAAIGEDVTLRTEIKGEANTLPRGKLYLTLEDGKDVFLAEGGKYIDDFTADTVPTCEDHLEIAHRSTLDSLSGQGSFMLGMFMVDMAELDVAKQDAEFCSATAPDGSTAILSEPFDSDDPSAIAHEGQSLDCTDVHKRMAVSDFITHYDISPAEHQRLLAQNAPFISAAYSTYGENIYAYDRIAREVTLVSYSGC